MPALLDDAAYGFRLLRRSPGFSLAATLALALGIGANTAIFSVVDAVLLAPLPYKDADRLVVVWEDASQIGFPRDTPAPANWVDWRKQNTVFTDIAASRGSVYSLTGDGPPEQVFGRRVTANLWSVLGVRAVMGRVFTQAEEDSNAAVAVIGYGLWQRRFGGANDIVGRKILLNNQPHTVIGVMPRGFAFSSRLREVWTPSGFTPKDLENRGAHYLQCVARLKPGVTLAQAQSEMKVIMKRLERQYPESNQGLGATIVPIREQVSGDSRAALIALLCAAGCVLLIACANIANLLMARSAQRQREMAVRAAIGAGRGRLIRQMLTESLLLSMLGALAGLAVAQLAMQPLESLVPAQMAAVELRLDARLLAFTLAISVSTGLLFGIAPALAGARLNLIGALKQGGRGNSGGARGFLRDGLVLVQVSLALVLLTGAGLMIRTLYRLDRVDLGIRTDHLLTLETYTLPGVRYPTHASRVAFVNAVLERVRALPGVLDAGYTSDLPLASIGGTSMYVLAGQSAQDAQNQDALFRVVTADFLQTMGVRLREGRFFSSMDRENTQPVAIVNESLANRHWPRQSGLGKRFQIENTGPDAPWLTVVGVVKEIRERGIDVALKPAVYLPHAQAEHAWPIPTEMAIRTSVDPLSLVSAVRQAVWNVDKDQAISRVRTMETVADEGLATRRQSMVLLAAFAALALVLAMIGIYGVLSYMVAQRSREIAVRMAIGARPSQVLEMVAGHGMRLTGGGLAIGIAASLAVTRLIHKLLFEVRERDPWTLAAVSALLTVVALTACLLPASRAARVDPARALRNE